MGFQNDEVFDALCCKECAYHLKNIRIRSCGIVKTRSIDERDTTSIELERISDLDIRGA